jgi:uncharacterized protein YdiU (UPF0061 family)
MDQLVQGYLSITISTKIIDLHLPLQCSSGLDEKMLIPLLDYLLKYHYTEIGKKIESEGKPKVEGYIELYKEIVRRTARLVAQWQCYGFCHGVLNTDNMSILGVTIDFGPFGWMDNMNKDHICNQSDKHGRYSYANQPSICKWNLEKLAQAIGTIVPFKTLADYLEENYDELYEEQYYGLMREKVSYYNCYACMKFPIHLFCPAWIVRARKQR